jgi:hypothetical protein
MESLPTALFPVFQDYLSSLSYRRFLSSCVAWKAVKRDTAYFKLSREYSQKFLVDSSFRTKLLSRVKDKSKQICLRCYDLFGNEDEDEVIDEDANRKDLKLGPADTLEALKHFQDVHNLSFSDWSVIQYIKQVSYFSGIHTLQLHEAGSGEIKDFNGLTNVYNLTLQAFGDIQDLSGLPFSTLHSLTLRDCCIADVSCLGDIHTLKLINCGGFPNLTGLGRKNYDVTLHYLSLIKDFNILGNCHKLQIFDCPLFEDVSGLGNVYDLYIAGCPQVRKGMEALTNNHRLCLNAGKNPTDFSSMRRVVLFSLYKAIDIQGLESFSCLEYLKLVRCSALRDISILARIKTLKRLVLRNCKFITNVTMFGFLRYLKIFGNIAITDLTGLGSVFHIYLKACHALRSLKGLGVNNHRVYIQECPLISDFSPLKQCHMVLVSDCPGFNKVSDVSDVHSLLLYHIHQLNDVSSLKNVQFLVFFGCSGLTTLEGLENVHTLYISACGNLVSCGNKTMNNDCVRIQACDKLTDVSALSSVRVVRLINCPVIQDVRALKKCVVVEWDPTEETEIETEDYDLENIRRGFHELTNVTSGASEDLFYREIFPDCQFKVDIRGYDYTDIDEINDYDNYDDNDDEIDDEEVEVEDEEI